MKRLQQGVYIFYLLGFSFRRKAQNTVLRAPKGRLDPAPRTRFWRSTPPPPPASGPVPDWQLLRSALWNPGRSPRLNEAYFPQARAGDTEGLFCPGARGAYVILGPRRTCPPGAPPFSCSAACHSDVILSRTVQTHHTWPAVWKHARTSAHHAENTQLSKELNLTSSKDAVFSWLYLTARQVEKSTHLEIKTCFVLLRN